MGLIKKYIKEINLREHTWTGDLYHFTHVDNIDDINHQGLQPKKNTAYDGCTGVFITSAQHIDDSNISGWLWDEYELSAEEEDFDYTPIIRITININDLDIDKLYPDDDYMMMYNLKDIDIKDDFKKHIIESFRITKSICYTDVIKPSSFKNVEQLIGYKEYEEY